MNQKGVKDGLVALLWLLVLAAPLFFVLQSVKGLRQDIKTLAAGQSTIVEEIQALKQSQTNTSARPRRPVPNVRDKVFNLSSHAITGENTATLTLIEFTDYQ